MVNAFLQALLYYTCAFALHLGLHLRRAKRGKAHHLPEWANKSKAHRFAALCTTTGVAAGQETVQTYVVHGVFVVITTF